jgi:hypothetical protein
LTQEKSKEKPEIVFHFYLPKNTKQSYLFHESILYEHLQDQSKLFSFNHRKSAELDEIVRERTDSHQKQPHTSESLALDYSLHIYYDLIVLSNYLDKSLDTVKLADQNKLDETVDVITRKIRNQKR